MGDFLHFEGVWCAELVVVCGIERFVCAIAQFVCVIARVVCAKPNLFALARIYLR